MIKKISLFLAAFAVISTATISLAEDAKKSTSSAVEQVKPEANSKKAEVNAKNNNAKYVPAKAVEGVSYAHPKQLNFGEGASEVKQKLNDLHDYLMIVITAITIFVLLLLIYVCIRFRAKANPVPSKTTHNTLIEIIWIVLPIIILITILIPSWNLIKFMDTAKDPKITIKAIGYQWYWGYEYMDGIGKGIKFESYMKKAEELKEGEPRLLETDNRVVLPINTDIRILTTSNDVIHAFTVPAFGFKVDAVPGRLNETWVNINKAGVYYGQCSELCGSAHAFMPIAVEAVEPEVYKAWVASKGGELEPKAEDKIKTTGTNALTYKTNEEKAKQK